MQGNKTLGMKTYYQVNLEDMVPRDNYYRQLNSVLELRWLYARTKAYYGREGHRSIDPIVFFKLCIVGYLNNLGSDRKLIEFCSDSLAIRLFLGYDIDEQLPWHSTISRTRKLLGEEVFLELFKQVLSMCVSKGMVRGKRQAVDSAFVKANASLDSLLEKEVMDDAQAYANELDEGSEYKVSPRKKKEVDAHHKWKEQEYKNQPGHGKKDDGKEDENGNRIRGKYLSNHTHYSPTDRDARISVKPGKARQMNYFAQVAVDDTNHVITAAMADTADKRDSQCLESIVDQCIENLSEHLLTPEQLAADAGYSSGESLQYCEAKGIDAYIPNFGQYKPEREGFSYNPTLDQYECERGNKAVLPYKKTSKSHDNYEMKVYRSSNKQCKDCPLRSVCIGKSDFKAITVSVHKPLYDRMHAKMQTPKARRMSRIRSRTVEPVLGTLLNFTGMKRVNARGLRSANKHVLMAALCYNLKKYLKFPGKKAKVIAMEVRAEVAALRKLVISAHLRSFWSQFELI